MGGKFRWQYMGDDTHNPPTDDCPQCIVPSKTHHQGAKTVDGIKHTRFCCEHGHTWTVREAR